MRVIGSSIEKIAEHSFECILHLHWTRCPPSSVGAGRGDVIAGASAGGNLGGNLLGGRLIGNGIDGPNTSVGD